MEVEKAALVFDGADDLEHIRDRIASDNPSAAAAVVASIYNAVLTLRSFPNRGRPGARKGTRELVVSPLPYIVAYRVTERHVEISRIWHGAQLRH